MEEERKEKLCSFHEMIEMPDDVNDERGKTLHIAFIGSPGSGKSSFINSIITAISKEGKYNEWSPVGTTRDGSHVTPTVIRYKKEDYLWREKEFQVYNYPTLVDVPGLCADDDQEFQKEILRLILFGKLTEIDNYKDIFRFYREHCDSYREANARDDVTEKTKKEIKEYGLGMVRERYSSRKSLYKIDRVVAVSTCKENDELPEKLIDTVKNVCLSESRKIQLFGVLTHRDQAGPSYHQREEEFLKMLGIPRTRFISCLCHCDNYAKELERKLLMGKFPELDAPLLEFMTSVCNPTTLILNDAATYTGLGIGLLTKIKAIPNDVLMYYAFLFGTMVVLLSSLLYQPRLFSKDELDYACRLLKYTDYDGELCMPEGQTKLTEASFPFFQVLLISFVIVLESVYREKFCRLLKKRGWMRNSLLPTHFQSFFGGKPIQRYYFTTSLDTSSTCIFPIRDYYFIN